MDKEKLKEILAKHKLWLAGDQNGERANLSGANLSGANLRGANFYGADFYGADLRGTNLRNANLSGANFYGANFYGANFYGANLSGANFYGADLRDVDLRGADLVGADLVNAKGVVTFTAGRNLASYTPHNKYLKIGCEGHDLGYWLENYKSIGKDSNYSEQEIKTYGGFIKLCCEMGHTND